MLRQLLRVEGRKLGLLLLPLLPVHERAGPGPISRGSGAHAPLPLKPALRLRLAACRLLLKRLRLLLKWLLLKRLLLKRLLLPGEGRELGLLLLPTPRVQVWAVALFTAAPLLLKFALRVRLVAAASRLLLLLLLLPRPEVLVRAAGVRAVAPVTLRETRPLSRAHAAPATAAATPATPVALSHGVLVAWAPILAGPAAGRPAGPPPGPGSSGTRVPTRV